MKKQKLFAGLTCAALLAAPNAAMADSTDVQLIVNNAYVGSSEAEGQVYINDAGRTMIPLRLVSEVLDYETNWQPDGSIHITSVDGTVDVTLQVGSTAYIAGGEAGTFETAPTLKNDRIYLPARDFAELYGSIYWDNDTRTVWISQSEDTAYQVIGTKLMRDQNGEIQQVMLPEGYAIFNNGYTEPIVGKRMINDVNYLAIMCEESWSKPVPLFRDDGDHLTYLTDIYPSSFYVDGNHIYYTDGINAGAWSNPIEPNRLYVADLTTGQTTERIVDFEINDCTLNVVDDVLSATSPDGTQHVVLLD